MPAPNPTASCRPGLTASLGTRRGPHSAPRHLCTGLAPSGLPVSRLPMVLACPLGGSQARHLLHASWQFPPPAGPSPKRMRWLLVPRGTCRHISTRHSSDGGDTSVITMTPPKHRHVMRALAPSFASEKPARIDRAVQHPAGEVHTARPRARPVARPTPIRPCTPMPAWSGMPLLELAPPARLSASRGTEAELKRVPHSPRETSFGRPRYRAFVRHSDPD